MNEQKWYDPSQTKKTILCLMNGCKICTSNVYCQTHDKPGSGAAPSIPDHCEECGEFIMDKKRDTRGMFS